MLNSLSSLNLPDTQMSQLQPSTQLGKIRRRDGRRRKLRAEKLLLDPKPVVAGLHVACSSSSDGECSEASEGDGRGGGNNATGGW